MKVRSTISWFALLLLGLALCTPAWTGAGCGTAVTSGVTSSATSPLTSVMGGTTEPAAATSTSAVSTSATTLPSPEQTILSGLTLRQKAAQVLLLALDGTTLLPSTQQLLAESPPGGFLLLGSNITAGADQLRSLTSALQDAAAAGGARVGLFIAVDQEGGAVERIQEGVPDVPAARQLGDTSSPAEARKLAVETATGLLQLGVNMNLAPVADVVSDRRSFLYGRTYGGDPTLVADFVEAVTRAYVQNGLIVVVKHFPGHGSANGNTHYARVVSDASEADFATIHLPPFKAAFAAGADAVMVAHIVASAYDPDLPASLSSHVIQGLLREGLGFSGAVVTDDLEMLATTGAGPTSDPGELAVMALQAGCDLLISTGSLSRQRAMIDAIVEAVQTGRLSEDRLDEAVLRMLEIKLRHGLVRT